MQNQDLKKALDIKENAAIRLNLALAYRDGSKFDLAQLYIKENKKQTVKEHFKNVILYSPGSEFAKQSKEYLKIIGQKK
jgi:hypothetical protein